MKKTLSILLAVVFCLTLFPLTAAADDPVPIIVTIADDTDTIQQLPTYTLYNYGKAQYIIPADKLAPISGKSIVELHWYMDNIQSFRNRNIQLILSETDAETMNGLIDVSGGKTVFQGEMPLEKEIIIQFNDSFVYSGTRNLLVTVIDNTGAWYGGFTFFGSTQQSHVGYSIYSDGTSYDANTTIYEGIVGSKGTRDFLPKTTLYAVESGTTPTTPTEVTVNFDAKGGTLSEADTSLTVKPGDTYGELPIPKREGYTFDGWFTEDYQEQDYNEVFYDKSIAHGFLLRISPLKTASTTPSGFLAGQVLDFDITLEGAVPVKLDMNDSALSSGTHYTIDGSRVYGSVAITSSLHHGEYTFLDIECSAEPTGYTIQYFRVFPSSDAQVKAGTTVTKKENHTLYAGWSKKLPVANEVSITFLSSNDGTGETKTVQTAPGEYTLPPCDFEAPTGKQFKAWLVGNEEKKPGGKINVTSNQTITAVWEDAFTVSFDTGGYSDVPPEQTVMKGEKAKAPDPAPAPYKDDLTFGGWKIVENGSEKDYDFDTPVEKDIKLIAIWYVKTTPSYVTKNYSLTLMKAYFVDQYAPEGSATVYESEVVITTAVVKEPTYTSSGVIEYIASAQDPSKETHILKTWTEIIPPLSGSSDWIRKSLAMGAALFNPPKKQTDSKLPEPEKQPDPVIVTVDEETPAIADEPAEPEIPFVDAAPGDPYYTAIVYAFRSGLMKGISDTEFGPSGTLNRAMFVTILGRLDQIDPADYAGCPFEDCEPLGDWDYLPYVAWAAENGIVLGFGDGTFRPFDPVTNEQAVLMLRRYADYLGRETAAPEIAYEGASPWASAAVAWAYADGIYPTETEAPFTSPAERGWTARAFYNFVGFLMK